MMMSGSEQKRLEDAEQEVRRLKKAVSTMAWWLVQAQTGFGQQDAQRIEEILEGKV